MISEYVVAHVIAHERKFDEIHAAQGNKEWINKTTADYRPLSDLKIGILGVGKLGSRIARSFKSYGSEVYGLVRHISSIEGKLAEEKFVDHYCLMNNKTPIAAKEGPIHGLERILEECDYIVSVLPKTADTYNILGNGKLALCKGKGAVLINVGRSNIITQRDLLEALDNNWIDKAILDVFDEEPLDPNDVYWTHPKVKITPHVAAISRPKEIAQCFKINYELALRNQALNSVVNWNEKY